MVLEAIAPAGEELVHVALVADVEDELVLRRVEDAVQRDGQLDDAEVRARGARRFAKERGSAHRELPGRAAADSCSRSALMSAGERIPSSKRFDAW